MDRKMVEFIKEQYPPGTRIRLNSMDDPYAPIAPGTEGEVDFVDDIGQLHMKWDNGRTLALVPGEDSFSVLPPKLTTLKLYIQLTWDGSQYTGTATDTNGVLSQYRFRANISGVTISQRRNVLTVTATKEAGAQLNGCVSSDYGYSLDVEGTESVLLEPSNGSNYQACAALTSLPDPVWAYIHFKVNILEEKGNIAVRKVDATGAPLAGAELLLETSADGKTWAEVGRITTDSTGVAKWENLKIDVQYRVMETKAPAGYTLLTEPLFAGALDSSNRDITITACNNAGFSLPFTGGTGFTTYFLFAALMLCMGVYFCKKSNIKKETAK